MDMEYTCKDCIFFDKDACRFDAVDVYTAEFSESCSRFECKNEFDNK